MKLFLVRHGETDYNRRRRYQGRSDTVLNRTGKRQAARLQKRLKSEDFHAVYSSCLARAMQTARLIADGRGLEIIACDRLMEMDFGQLEGLTYDEVTAKYPHRQPTSFDFSDCGGEDLPALALRMRAFVEELRDNHSDRSSVLVVSHGGCLGVLLCLLLNMDVNGWWQFNIAPASLTIVEDAMRHPELALLNDVSHL